MADFVVLRSRWGKKILRQIDVGKATGPDGIPGRLRKECAAELAPIIVRIARRCLAETMWPKIWRYHWIQPLHKKKQRWLPNNYRGIHLTSIVSKTVKRVIGTILVNYLDCSNAYGDGQWAFRPKRNCRDLVALLVCSWIPGFSNKFKTGLFLSDISGAFDKVDTDILLAKCKRVGLAPNMLLFLKSFFAPRCWCRRGRLVQHHRAGCSAGRPRVAAALGRLSRRRLGTRGLC